MLDEGDEDDDGNDDDDDGEDDDVDGNGWWLALLEICDESWTTLYADG